MHLLSSDIDYKRWIAEEATYRVIALRNTVRALVSRSARTGTMCEAQEKEHRIAALVRANDGETYRSIIAQRFVDPLMLVTALDAIPGVSADD